MSLISERKQRCREAPSQAQTGFSVDTGHRRGKSAKGRGDCRPPHFRRPPTCFLGAHPRPRAPLGPAVSRQQSEAQRPWASRGPAVGVCWCPRGPRPLLAGSSEVAETLTDRLARQTSLEGALRPRAARSTSQAATWPGHWGRRQPAQAQEAA